MPNDENNNTGKPGDFEEIPPSNEDAYIPPEEQYGEQESPAVAAGQGKNAALLIIAVAVIGLIFLLFSGSDDDAEEISRKSPVAPTTPTFVPSQPVAPIAPPAPPIIAPPAPPIIQQVEDDKPPTIFDPDNPGFKKRVQSQMVLGSSGIFGGGNDGGLQDAVERREAEDVYSAANDNDPNVGFADSFYNQKNVPHAFARKLGNTSKLITQGKVLEVVLETPINTDIPGMIRAIVSRDVYAESGRKILIPKGSRVIGTYNNFIIRGNKRVNIIWSRVIRPDGIDIMVRSGGADQLGRAGIEGLVDNKYAEIFASAFLVSAINISIGLAVEGIRNDQISETTNTDGSTTRTSTASQESAIRAIDLFGNAAENLVKDFINLKPTITIDQGTRVNIFVNRDLLFPDDLTNEVRIVQ